jgi:hypothetical protein
MCHPHSLHYYQNKRIFKHNLYLLDVNNTKYVCDASFFRFRHFRIQSPKAIITFVMFVFLSFLLFLRLALRMYQMDSQWRDYFQENCYWILLLKCVEKLNILLKFGPKYRALHMKTTVRFIVASDMMFP